MRLKTWIQTSFAALLMLSLNACTQTYGRSQLMLLTPEQERQIGESGRDEILQQSKLSTDKKAIAQVTRVGQKIAKAANQSDFEWEFYVIEDKTVNAFCLPTGKVFVYTGILPFVSSDDELATIMGHEIAHAILRHGAERMSMAQVSDMGQQLTSTLAASLAPDYAPLVSGAYSVVSQYGVMLPYGRDRELEADKAGLELMIKAGYDPQAAPRFWQKMAASSQSSDFDFFSTHPSDSKRIAQLQSLIKQQKSR